MNQNIRQATVGDSNDILKIYSYYVENTAISFEITTPSVIDFSRRIENIITKYPYLVYIIDGKIVGYAYASKHRERAAYCYDVDVSIYILQKYHGCGISAKLYNCLFDILKEQGYYNAYAGFTVPNEKSEYFHKKLGFTVIGTYHKTGYKFNKWYDVTWMEKTLKQHTDNNPDHIKLIKQLSDEYLLSIFSAYTS